MCALFSFIFCHFNSMDLFLLRYWWTTHQPQAFCVTVASPLPTKSEKKKVSYFFQNRTELLPLLCLHLCWNWCHELFRKRFAYIMYCTNSHRRILLLLRCVESFSTSLVFVLQHVYLWLPPSNILLVPVNYISGQR